MNLQLLYPGRPILLPQISFLNELILLASTPCLLDTLTYCMVNRVSLDLATQGDFRQCMGGVMESRLQIQKSVLGYSLAKRMNIPRVIHVCLLRLKHMEYA